MFVWLNFRVWHFNQAWSGSFKVVDDILGKRRTELISLTQSKKVLCLLRDKGFFYLLIAHFLLLALTFPKKMPQVLFQMCICPDQIFVESIIHCVQYFLNKEKSSSVTNNGNYATVFKNIMINNIIVLN